MAALQGQKTGEFVIYRCATGHSPHPSWTDGVVDTALEFVQKVRNQSSRRNSDEV